MRLNEFVGEFGLTRGDVGNWLERHEFRTDFAETARGSARQFSRFNVLELALVGAAVKGGCKASKAPMWAEVIVDDYRHRRHKVPNWLVISVPDFESGLSCSSLDPETLAEFASRSPHSSVLVINAKDIADRVDSLFNKAEAE